MGARQSTAQSPGNDISASLAPPGTANAAAMGTSASRRRTLSGSNGRDGVGGVVFGGGGGHHLHHQAAANSQSSDARQRARSLSHVTGGHGIGIPSGVNGEIFDLSGGTPDSDGGSSGTPEETGATVSFGSFFGTRVYAAHSLPTQLSSAFNGIKCPVCSKFVIPDDIECHLVMCLTKPRISYNEDVLREDTERECVICLDELNQGDTIARLPCLCIYHKSCIDSWFEVNRSCPEHPLD